MSNHVHLLVTGLLAGGVSSMMQSLGRRYVRRFNNRYGRTGTLWEGRFKSSLVDSERYLLTCYRYIELNPVRAKMVESPFEHLWSSVHANAAGELNHLVTPHSVYLDLDPDPDDRQMRYRDLLLEGVSSEDLVSIRQHLGQSKALGSLKFQQEIEALTGRSARLRKPGRPKRST